MIGITINNIHTSVYGIGLTAYSNNPPEVRTHYVEILGRDGNLDLTENISGRPIYSDREIIYELCTNNNDFKAYIERCSLLDSLCHGKRIEVIEDADPEYKWIGRASWEHAYSADGEIHTLHLTAEPYKYKKNDTVVNVTFSGATKANPYKVTLTNLYAPAHPKYKVTDGTNVVLIQDNIQMSLPKDVVINGLPILGGEKEISFTGSGTVEITYTEGTL